MKIVILGPPGSGKGTYASLLKNRLGLPHISTGDLVREEIRNSTELGLEIKKYSDAGQLVPDNVITEILKKRLDPDPSAGFILEGYPRSVDQARQLENITKINVVINLNVPDRVIVERLSTRIQCRICGAIYNERTLTPRIAGKCDRCGGELFKRADDQPDVILERLRIYKETSAPVIDYYRTRKLLKEITNDDPNVTPEIVAERILNLI
jgi:adenylate kinase